MTGLRLGIVGINGRLGGAIAARARSEDVAVTGIGRGGDVVALSRQCDVLIDVSLPEATGASIDAATETGIALIVATTGLDGTIAARIDAAAARIAILQTGNLSLGVTLLTALVEQAAARLDWDIEIVETHHRMKRDAPSGTALLLGEAAAVGRGAALADLRRDRSDGPRVPGTIGFASLRGGSVVGDHRVALLGDGEQIHLAHRAEDRAVFATGAIAAACFLAGRAPGRYTMRDVLGL